MIQISRVWLGGGFEGQEPHIGHRTIFALRLGVIELVTRGEEHRPHIEIDQLLMGSIVADGLRFAGQLALPAFTAGGTGQTPLRFLESLLLSKRQHHFAEIGLPLLWR